MRHQLTVEEYLAILRDAKRRKCLQLKQQTCATCAKKYGNLCFAASVKSEICLN